MNLVVYFLQQVVNALSLGSLYALMAVGLAMVFGILRLINFAHGDIMMVAAYFAAFGLINQWPLPLTLLMMIAGTVLVGLIIERVGYRPVRGAPEITALLTSFAVGQILESGTLILTRLMSLRSPLPLPSIDVLSGVVNLGPITVAKLNLVALVSGGVLLALLTYFVTQTNLGLSMRAAAEDLTAANLVGININRVIAVAFAISSGMAAVAGLLYAAQAGQINPYMGFTPVLKAFIAAVIGGFGSLAGAVVGGYVLGGLEVLLIALPGIGTLLTGSNVSQSVINFLNTWLPGSLSGYRDAFVFIALILVLLFRPNGLLGRRDQEEMT
jgi:branched-chain amino acid transport system permease protein